MIHRRSLQFSIHFDLADCFDSIMVDRRVTLICYMNGAIVNGPFGISYTTAPIRHLRSKLSLGYEELVSFICNALEIDIEKMILHIVYRYPVYIGTGTYNYVPLQIVDESTLKDAWDIVAECPPPNCMELFLDLVPRQLHTSSNIAVSAEGPSIQPPFERNYCASPLMTLNHDVDEETHALGVCGGVNDDDDDDDCCSDGNTTDQSSDDANDEGIDALHVPDSIIRDALNQVIAEDGSLSCPPILDEVGNNNFFDQEANGLNDSPVGVGEFVVPSSVFMELSSEAMTPLHENTMIPSKALWNEASDFHVGMRFFSKGDFQHAVKLYNIKVHRQFVVTHSTPNVWIVCCKKLSEGCAWRLRCSKRKAHGMFEISKYEGPHTCINAKLSKDHAHLDSAVICREIENVVRRDPSISVPVLHQIIKDKFSYDVHYKKVWLAKKKAVAKIFGDWEESYKMLPRWMAALQESNPGTRVDWRYGEPNANNEVVFKWVFWAFAPSIAGFRHCRPLIQIDGTFLYGKYKQKLLIATVVDSNSHIFPLAFAIVDEESQDSWGWFMACLRHHVTDRDGICVISDRHPGILLAMNDPRNGWTCDRAKHRFCLRHICSNFNMRFGSKELKNMVYLAGAQHQPRKFKAYMQELQQINAESIAWFNDLDRAQWTNAYDKGYRYGWMTTNLAECFNGVLKGARFYPVTALVQVTFYRIMAYFNKRHDEIGVALGRAEKYTKYALDKLQHWGKAAGGHNVTLVNRENGTFEVITGTRGYHLRKGSNKQVVKLAARRCTCMKWQCFGIPCSHVQAACTIVAMDYFQYI